jgi:hypothetical protein
MIVENDCLILQILKMSTRARREGIPISTMIIQQAEREIQRRQANREELVERVSRVIREDGTVQPLPGLRLARSSSPTVPLHGVSTPSVCVIAQGGKEVLLGESRYRYDPLHYLLATIELPSVS